MKKVKGAKVASQADLDKVASRMKKKTQGFGKKSSEGFAKKAKGRLDSFIKKVKL